MFKHSLSFLVVAGLLISLAPPAPAETVYFTPANGDWGVASNWSTIAVPAASSTAYVGGAGTTTGNLATCTFTAADTDTINSLFLGSVSGGNPDYGPGVLNMTGGTLTVTNPGAEGLSVETAGVLAITNGAQVVGGGYVAGGAHAVIHIDGAGSAFMSNGFIGGLDGTAVTVSGGGTLNINNGQSGSAGVGTMGGTFGTLVEADVGSGSSILAYGLTASSSLYTRVVCGASPAALSTYTPMTFASWGNSIKYQGVGGVWATNSDGTGTHLFTASNVVTGNLGSSTSINTNVNQRALWTDTDGNRLGASFLYSGSSTTITPTVTALPSTTAPTLAAGQFLEGDWGLSGGLTASPTNPVYLSLSVPSSATSTTLYYSSNGTTWTPVSNGLVPTFAGSGNFATAAGYDMTSNGTYYSFCLTGTSGNGNNGLGFSGFDYAVVYTVPEPASGLLIAAALAGLAAYAWRKRLRA